MLRSDDPQLLGREESEQHGAAWWRGAKQSRKLEDRGRTRGVVVRTVSDRGTGIGIERASGGATEMIVVGADDDDLASDRWIAAGQEGEHILRGETRTGGSVRRRPRGESLEIARHRRLETE
jgi:hypothetical protein